MLNTWEVMKSMKFAQFAHKKKLNVYLKTTHKVNNLYGSIIGNKRKNEK